jgi:anti-anti-sigma factor
LTVIEPATTTAVSVHRADRGADTALADPLSLCVDGELDAFTAGAFAVQLTAEAGEGTGPDVLLDLGRLYRLDADGLLALAGAAASLARAGRRLALACVRPRVREFLAYSGAEALVPVFATVELAAEHARLSRPLSR